MILVLAALPQNGRCAERWIKLTTPHFEMDTTNSEKQGTAALKVFEQVRYFFLQNSHSKSVPDTPVRIVAFRSEKEFKPYRLNEGAFAYYLRSRKMDYIVMQDISSEHYQAAVHEYTHLIVEHLNLKLPIWLNEGLADVYSSLEPRGDQALIGRPLPGRAVVLMNQSWLDWNTLFAVGYDSPYYNERDKMSIFYAQSWALTHMLALGKGYLPNFSKFMAAIESGRPAAECLRSVYGKSLAQITKDLHAYLNQATVQGALFDVKLGKLELEPAVADLPDWNVQLALADLLSARKSTSDEAAQRLAMLAQERPESAEVQESLGYLAWQQGNKEKARECFKLAAEKGSDNPEMFFHYAELLRESGAPPDQTMPPLQRAVELKPDYADAWFNLGAMQANARKPAAAIQSLAHLKTISPDRAYSLFLLQAYCYLQLHAPDQARALAQRAKEYAKTSGEQMQVSEMLQQADRMTKQVAERTAPSAPPEPKAGTSAASPVIEDLSGRPSIRTRRELARDEPTVHWPENLQHVETVVKSLDCSSKKLRIHALAGAKEMVFALDDPESVIVRNGTGSFQMQCGPQKPTNLGIFYVPATGGAGVDGVIHELVF